nr:transcription factor MYB73-like [Ipomoea batatas]
MREVTELVTVLSSRVKLRISDLERDAEQRAARGNHLPGGDKEGGNVKQMLQRPWRLDLIADATHCSVQNDAIETPFWGGVTATESDKESNCAAERLGVEESRQAIGEAVALVIDGANGESMLGYVNSGELHEPAGLAGEAVDGADCTYELGGRERGPPLSEELEAAGIGDELGTVGHRMAGIELVGTQGPKRALLVRLCHRMLHLPLLSVLGYLLRSQKTGLSSEESDSL